MPILLAIWSLLVEQYFCCKSIFITNNKPVHQWSNYLCLCELCPARPGIFATILLSGQHQSVAKLSPDHCHQLVNATYLSVRQLLSCLCLSCI